MVAMQGPRNLREAAAVEAVMKRKYPQMYTEEWQAMKKRKKKGASSVDKIKEGREAEKTALEGALTGDEIKRMVGR